MEHTSYTKDNSNQTTTTDNLTKQAQIEKLADQGLQIPNQPNPNTLRRVIANPRTASRAAILMLQRTYGNQAVLRLLSPKSRPSEPSIIQRFANEHNEARLKEARVQAGFDPNPKPEKGKKTQGMQLDHAVSQDTLKLLPVSINKLRFFTSPKETSYTQSKQALQSLFKQLKTQLDAQDFLGSLTNELLNLPQNITPGYKLTTGNPGETFDPQIALTGAKTDSTFESDELFKIDNAIRKLNRLESFFPKELTEAMYNERLDAQVAEALTDIATGLEEIKGSAEPNFESNTWYDYGDLKVKKVGGEWQDQKPANLGNQQGNYPANLQLVTHNWNFTLANLEQNTSGGGKKKTAKGYKADITVNVTVRIPVSCWQHIYDRHTISHFAGDVQAINTFWKLDPFTNIDQAMLEPEINLLLDRKYDLYSVYRNGDKEEDNIDEPVNKLFFQGSLEAIPAGQQINVSIGLDSIAPQNEELGYAIQPNILNG